MTRYFDTPDGPVPFTPEQEAQRDAEEAAWINNAAANYVNSVKSTAYAILQPTDWLVVRKVENGTEIPADWNTWREDIRLEAQEKITIIESSTTEELFAYIESAAYAYWPPEPTTPKL